MSDDRTRPTPEEFEGVGLGETIRQVIDGIEYFTLDKRGPTLHAVEETDEDDVMHAYCGEGRSIVGPRVIRTFDTREEIERRDFERVCEECITTADPNPDEADP